LEVEANIRLLNSFSLRPNVTISTNKNKNTFSQINGNLLNLKETDISFSPNLIAANNFIFHPSQSFQISLLSKYVGSQFMGNTNSIVSKLDSYFVNDFSVIYQLKPKTLFKSVIFSVLVNNIFGIKYVSNGYYYTYDDTWSSPSEITTVEGAGYYPQATTNFLMGVTFKF